MSRKFPLSMIISLILITGVDAGQIAVQRTLTAPELEFIDGFHHFVSPPGPLFGEPGAPALPYTGHQLLLPPGEEIVSVQVVNDVWQSALGQITLWPAQPPVPYSHTGEQPFTPPDPSVYGSDDLFPNEIVSTFRTGFLNGHGMGSFSVCAARYQPASGRLELLTSYHVVVETAPTARAAQAFNTMLRRTPEIDVRITRNVENPEALSAYGAPDGTDDIAPKYLIVTTGELAPFVQPLADYRTSRGLQAEIVLVEDIEVQYTGIDLPDKIRNCVLDYYQSHAIEYVLLAGDAECVPKRGFYAQIGGTIDQDIPADLYFSNLDGTWNDDMDSRYGEPGEEDFYAEVAVGRLAVDSETEAQNLINKIIMYENTPVTGDLEEALMLGEDLDWNVWGGEYKEEIRLGSSMWGYTTVGFPPNFNVDVLYDMYGTWSGFLDFVPRLNAGLHLVNHLGHSNVTYCMKLTHGGITDQNLTNNGTNHNFYILYSQGCYDGSFDNRTTGGGYTTDCIAEDFTVIQNGAVAFLCNSRYGWGSYNTTQGPSQYYDRQFFDAIFAEEIYNLGWINADSKEDNVPFINQGATHWVYYEMNLIGDPALDVWTSTPQNFAPSHPDQLVQGTTQFDVIAGVPGADVILSFQGEILAMGETNGAGTATLTLSEPLSGIGEMTLTLLKHDYIPYEGAIYAAPESGPYILVTNIDYDDSVGGNGDGNADLGETLSILLEVLNIGYDPAAEVTAYLECQDYCVQILDGFTAVGTLGPLNSMEIEDAFEVKLLPNVTDGQILAFSITVQDNQGSSWTEEFEITAFAPQLQLLSFTIEDGNDNWLMPGETATLNVEIQNDGSSATTDLDVWLSTDHPLAAAAPGAVYVSALASGDAGSADGLQLTLDPAIPDPSALVLYVTARDTRGYEAGFLIEVPVGGGFDDMESGPGEWIHESLTPGYGDQWNLSDLLNHTAGGQYSWYCGDGGLYAAYLDAALISPPFQVSGSNQLRFFQWMSAEIPMQSQYLGYAHDGGIVEMSINGEPFEQITPRGGYPFLIREASTPGPFQPDTPCFSGQILWEEAVFDILEEGTMQFRFRFGTNGDTASIGWCIDDLRLFKVSDPNPPTNLTITNAPAAVPEVTLTWNTPGLDPPEGKTSSGNRQQQSLEEYRVYRNGIFIDSVQALTYTDYLGYQPPGTYTYQVSAVFDGVEGPLSDPAIYDYLGVEPGGEPALPTETVLKSAYPNPFNPVVNLSFDLAAPDIVKLTVYDLMGRTVATLHDGHLNAGRHLLTWNAAQCASGLYFVRMQSGSYQGLQKILLLK